MKNTKRIISIALALLLVMSLSVAALAVEFKPDEMVSELEGFKAATNQTEQDVYVLSVNDATLKEEDQDKFVDLSELCEAEFGKFAASPSAWAYFGEVKDGKGDVISLPELIGDNLVDVSEFYPAVSAGYKEEFGNAVSTFLFPPTELGQKHILLIGIVEDEEKGELQWYAFEAKDASGEASLIEDAVAVEAEVTPLVAKDVQAKKALVALIYEDTVIKADTEFNPSRALPDMTKIMTGVDKFYLYNITEASLVKTGNYGAIAARCRSELGKLSSSNILSYFGEIKDASGNAAQLKDFVEGDLKVFEFCPVVAEGYKDEYKNVTASLLFPTPYEVGEQVAVMVGLLKGGSIEWTAFEGIGAQRENPNVENIGGIEAVFTPEIIKSIEADNGALLAIVSK